MAFKSDFIFRFCKAKGGIFSGSLHQAKYNSAVQHIGCWITMSCSVTGISAVAGDDDAIRMLPAVPPGKRLEEISTLTQAFPVLIPAGCLENSYRCRAPSGCNPL